ncbi:tetratricopeptide repeat protein [Parvicella tangerina]|nr:tetratricopeptide repeat protein [Parvicella tangerina]
MKQLLIIFILSVLTLPFKEVSAQKDSTFISINSLPDSDDKIFKWINAANKISESNPSKAVDYIEEGLKLSLDLDNVRGEAYCYNSLGGLQFTLGKFEKSVKYYKNALTLFEGFEDSEIGYYSSLKNIGASYEKLEEYETAISYYNKFLKQAKKKNEEDDIVFATNGLARCNQALQNYDDSEVYYQQAYSFEQKRNNTQGIINASNNLGNFYETVNDSVNAFNYFDTSLSIAQSATLTQNTDSIVPQVNGTQDLAVQTTNTYFLNADNYFGNRGMVDEQIQVNQQAAAYNEANDNPQEVNKANLKLGKLNLQKKNNKEAIEYLRNSINLSDELGELEAKEEALEAITQAYQEEGDYEQALLAYQELVKLQDSIQKEKNKQALLANNLSLELEQKDEQIELLLENENLKEEAYALDIEKREAENQNKLYIIYALIGILLIMTIAAIAIIRSNQKRAKTNMLLELKSLRTQMNPHFIFNSLNSVNSFISKNDDRSANKYLSRFSQLMRLVLENSKYDFVSLESELKIIELYMELEHLRFQDKFDYELNIAPNIETENTEIPPMLVQPYIENAVWHGLRYLEHKGNLVVKVEQNNNALTWTITDNGIGRQASAEMKTKNQKLGKSTGMKNIEQRLEILNKMHATQMKTSIIDLPEGGTKVILEIPIKK